MRLDPLHGREEEDITCTKRYGGDTVYRWDNGDTYTGHLAPGEGRRGWGVVTSPSLGLQIMSGVWGPGGLQGEGRVVWEENRITEGWFRDGCLHGLTRKIEIKKFRTFVQQVSETRNMMMMMMMMEVVWLGRHRGGVGWGQCWQWVDGGGWITGLLDSRGHFTGDNIAFLYPDLTTAIVGRFQEGVLVSGLPAQVCGMRLVEDIAVPEFIITGEKEEAVSFCRSSEESVGLQPLVRDPYESRTVEVRPSQVGGGGEGLFLRRNVTKGEIVAFYNGV